MRKGGSNNISKRVYELFPVLKGMRHHRVGDLSSGQQQQLPIGRTLMSEPRPLIQGETGEGIQRNIVAQMRAAEDEIAWLTAELIKKHLTF